MSPTCHPLAAPDAPPARRSVRLLVAEDAHCIQRNLRVLLNRMNIDADMAGDGQTACDLARQSEVEGRPYDLILMDMHMPRLNGFKATESLRCDGWKGPIVALSALSSIEDQQKIVAAGCDDYVPKPLRPETLQEVLARYLGPAAC